MNDPIVKPDPDVKYMDDDFYEDTGELQLPPKDAEKDIWVTRVPRWLFPAISKWDDLADGNDDDQIIIGEAQAFMDPERPGRLNKSKPIRLFFNDKWQEKAKLPSAFELRMSSASNDTLGNTYVFTEKDLPGYKPNGVGQNKSSSSFNLGVQDPKSRVQKRSKYKKAIPKQTALVGPSTREYNAVPIPTVDFVRFEKQLNNIAMRGANMHTNIMTNPMSFTNEKRIKDKFSTWIHTNNKPKSQLNKAARIPRNELVDMLHKCFDSYAYWPMKTLKAFTHQPEAFLKEILNEIADLVKTGSFASCWKRKAMYSARDITAEASQAPAAENEDENEDEMETVITV
ncbi:hypothetical protein EJ04DRAFT_508949 [Polyplosphaeria fusca]|uniref:Transcription initiation factor IIF subunit beta n=1 Tax=Polyplosphaeria fusca TaxID=682080 RepID=A0A9P4R9E1_9PLEO|nr:hypothetical protein EJ04DRAFT_508949 [Polyplosphaeria fusca]